MAVAAFSASVELNVAEHWETEARPHLRLEIGPGGKARTTGYQLLSGLEVS